MSTASNVIRTPSEGLRHHKTTTPHHVAVTVARPPPTSSMRARPTAPRNGQRQPPRPDIQEPTSRATEGRCPPSARQATATSLLAPLRSHPDMRMTRRAIVGIIFPPGIAAIVGLVTHLYLSILNLNTVKGHREIFEALQHQGTRHRRTISTNFYRGVNGACHLSPSHADLDVPLNRQPNTEHYKGIKTTTMDDTPPPRSETYLGHDMASWRHPR